MRMWYRDFIYVMSLPNVCISFAHNDPNQTQASKA